MTILQRLLYRLLFNPNLYLKAYAKIYCNKGVMTPGSGSSRWPRADARPCSSAESATNASMTEGTPGRA